MKKQIHIILQQDVENLGLKGQIVRASLGYARNFLFPNNLAILGTLKNIAQAQEKQKEIAKRESKTLEKAMKFKEKLEKSIITIQAKSSHGDNLFGSVGTREISNQINKRLKTDIDRKNIFLSTPIKKAGEYPVTIKIFKNIKAKTKLFVESNKAE